MTKTDRRGFTLLELLIALSLLAVVIASGYAAFVSGLNAVPRGEAIAERSARLRAATSIMTRQARSLVNYTRHTWDGEAYPYFEGSPYYFSFVTAAPRLSGGEGLSCVIYWVEGQQLWMGETPLHVRLASEGSRSPIANCGARPAEKAVLLDGLTGVQFRYRSLDGDTSESIDEWDSIDHGLPAAIEVSLEGLDPGRSEWKEFLPVMTVALGLGGYDPELAGEADSDVTNDEDSDEEDDE